MHLYQHFYVTRSNIHGHGCFCEEQLPAGLLIPIPCREVKHETPHTAEMEGRFFEPLLAFKYLNHHDEPNAELLIDEDGSMWLEILWDTFAHQEITFDYGA